MTSPSDIDAALMALEIGSGSAWGTPVRAQQQSNSNLGGFVTPPTTPLRFRATDRPSSTPPWTRRVGPDAAAAISTADPGSAPGASPLHMMRLRLERQEKAHQQSLLGVSTQLHRNVIGGGHMNDL